MIRVLRVCLPIVMLVTPLTAHAQDLAAAGQKVYETQKCSLCHSVAGKGNAKGSLDGVNQGELVILHPPDTLTDGARIRIRRQ